MLSTGAPHALILLLLLSTSRISVHSQSVWSTEYSKIDIVYIIIYIHSSVRKPSAPTLEMNKIWTKELYDIQIVALNTVARGPK